PHPLPLDVGHVEVDRGRPPPHRGAVDHGHPPAQHPHVAGNGPGREPADRPLQPPALGLLREGWVGAERRRLSDAAAVSRRGLEGVPKSAAAAQRSLWEAYPGRYLLGLGVSPASRERGQGPLPFMRDYLAEMDRTSLRFPGGEARPPRVVGAYSEGLMRLAG